MTTLGKAGDFFFYQVLDNGTTAPIKSITYTTGDTYVYPEGGSYVYPMPYKGTIEWNTNNHTFVLKKDKDEMKGKIEGSREVKYKVKEGDEEKEVTRVEFPALMPQRIIVSGAWTHCFFPDGTKQGKKVSVKFEGNPIEYSIETAVAECIAKYVFGTRSQFLKNLDKAHLQE